MDPITVLKTIWRYKFWVLPVVVMTLIAGAYVYQFGPRSFESSMSIAIVNPKIPSEKEMEKSPKLERMNKDNPYIRSPDPSLITDVLVTRLNSSQTARDVEGAGLGPEYLVGQGVDSNGFVIDITGIGSDPAKAVSTAQFLGNRLQTELRSVQKVNGADDTYLYTSLVVVQPDKAIEQFSSRLRSLIMVALGGGILLLGVVSIATSISRSRVLRRRVVPDTPQAGGPSNVQGIADAGGSTETRRHSDHSSTRTREQSVSSRLE